MHYVDEGIGEPIVFVHGNPAWSFEFRNLIKEFSTTNRCIAPDLIGFGLSDKPEGWSYLPKEQAKNLDLFLESLDLDIYHHGRRGLGRTDRVVLCTQPPGKNQKHRDYQYLALVSTIRLVLPGIQ